MSATNETIRIAGICGAMTRGSSTSKALTIALRGATEYDADTSLLELHDFDLVFAGSVRPDDYPPDVLRMRRAIRESQGIILATPEYQGTFWILWYGPPDGGSPDTMDQNSPGAVLPPAGLRRCAPRLKFSRRENLSNGARLIGQTQQIQKKGSDLRSDPFFCIWRARHDSNV